MIIGFSVLSGIVLALNIYTDGAVNQALMSWYTDWLDPAMYLRFFTHVLAHADFAHYFGNMSLLLVVGPLMEERYGARRLALMLFASAFTTGFANALLFKNVAVVGASGLVFTLILLSSFVNLRKGKLPLTLLIVGAMYIGNEVVNAILVDDSVSRLSHVIGGLCGAGFGFYFAGTPTKRLE